MSLRPLATAAALVLIAASAAAQAVPAKPPAPTTDLVVAGRKLANWILANQLDSVVVNLEPAASADEVRTELRRVTGEIAIHGGNELKVTEEKVVRRNGRYQYWRTADFQNAPEPVLLRIVLTPDGKYGGIGVGLASNAPPIDPNEE